MGTDFPVPCLCAWPPMIPAPALVTPRWDPLWRGLYRPPSLTAPFLFFLTWKVSAASVQPFSFQALLTASYPSLLITRRPVGCGISVSRPAWLKKVRCLAHSQGQGRAQSMHTVQSRRSSRGQRLPQVTLSGWPRSSPLRQATPGSVQAHSGLDPVWMGFSRSRG